MTKYDVELKSLPESESRVNKLTQQILDDRAREAERQRERQRERQQDSGPWWKKPMGFDPYQTTKWRAVAGGDPGTMPKIPMRQGVDGFYIHCRACNDSIRE